MRQYRRLALAKRIFIDHPQRYDAALRSGIPLRPCQQSRFSYSLTGAKSETG
jgi:hypothetical protein